MKKKIALCTGITGQDASYLAELLLNKGYDVHGLIRRCSTSNTGRIDGMNITLHYGDLADSSTIMNILSEINPSEIYNLGAQSHVKISFDVPDYTADITGIGTLRLLEAMRKVCPTARFYQAGSSEQFGSSPSPQNESTPFIPQSPYAAAKIFSYHIVHIYRKSYGLFATNGLLFNHTSEKRSDNFVTRKITKAATRIKLGLQDKLYLGNIDTYRDWGHARDYINAIWLMLQHTEPDDFVIASGESHSVKEFLEISFDLLGLDPYKYLKIDTSLNRPLEVNHLLGNPEKAKRILKWEPKISFKELVQIMIDNDMAIAQKEKKMLGVL